MSENIIIIDGAEYRELQTRLNRIESTQKEILTRLEIIETDQNLFHRQMLKMWDMFYFGVCIAACLAAVFASVRRLF